MELDVVIGSKPRCVWLNGKKMKPYQEYGSCRKIFVLGAVMIKLNDRMFKQNKHEVKVLEKWGNHPKYKKHLPKLLDYSLHYSWIAVQYLHGIRKSCSEKNRQKVKRIADGIGVGDTHNNNWGMYKGEVMLLDLGVGSIY